MGMAIAAIWSQESGYIGKVSIHFETGVVNEQVSSDRHGHERCTRGGCGSGVRTNKRHGFQLTEHAEPEHTEHTTAEPAERQLDAEHHAIAQHAVAQQHGVAKHTTAERTTVGHDIAEHGAAARRQREGRTQRPRLIRAFETTRLGAFGRPGRFFGSGRRCAPSHRCAM
jgi:hypothetical protein